MPKAKGVCFIHYDEIDLRGGDYFGKILGCEVCGVEDEDGAVTVYEFGNKQSKQLKNRAAFEEKYFTEAL